MSMTVFIDIDGTIFIPGTNEWLPEAEQLMKDMADQGHMIVITTYRGDREWAEHPIYSEGATIKALEGVKYDHIIFNSPSPRILINDQIALAVQVDPEEGITTDVLDDISYYLDGVEAEDFLDMDEYTISITS